MKDKKNKRSATIICNEEVHVAVLGKEDFQNAIMSSMEKELNEKVDFLMSFHIA